jgi:predicted ATPase/DNA-binding SARP family transcriptional activator/DNA-binding CsgD family transcriptional regulator
VADERSTARTRSGSEGTSDRALEAVRVRLLGGFRVSVGSRTIGQAEWPLRKAANLLKLLALAPGHRLHRERVMDTFWPDSGRRAASNSLRRTLHSARRVLDPDAGSRYLVSEDEQLVLCPDASLWVDVEAFEEAAAAARRSRVSAAYSAALDLYAGDLLPSDRYEEWAEEKRRGLRRLYLDRLVELAEAYEERSDLARAVEALRMAVAKEPALEEAHAGLMRLYALSGREGEALVQYERLRATLSKGLGFRPSTATKRLRDEIASGEFPSTLASLTGVLREERPLQSSGHNLPAPRTSFVGREREMLEVKRELAMTRLLTLTGVGGSGKTRLALEVARELVGAYPDGVWLAELAPLSEGELVPQTVAQALGVKERPGEQLTDTLVEFLRARHTLLVLDNCEHLVEAVAQLVDILLDACPGLRVLATSREALGIAGEMRQLVHPLSVPDPRQQLKAEELEGYESARLFVERAKYRNPAFALAEQDVQSVAQICDRLDGIPLAIELAAARVGALSVEQLLERLDDSLRLLTDGGRTAAPRQRTLRTTLDWSYELLSEPERVLFRRLSVFAGGWTLEASEAVGAGKGVTQSGVLDVLSGLVEKSLVVPREGDQGGVRYRILEPVRQYAREKLGEGDEAEHVRRRHAVFFLDLAEEAEPELWGPDDAGWLNRLEREHDNMRVALSWSLEWGEPELALRLAGASGWFWRGLGFYGEGRRWVEEALEKGSGASATIRAKALGVASFLAVNQGDTGRAQAAAEEGLRLSAEAGLGSVATADFQNLLGDVAGIRGDYERATKLLEEGLALHRESGDGRGVAWSLGILAKVVVVRGDFERAKELYEEGLTLSRELGGAELLGAHLISLGYVYLLEGDLEGATALNVEALELLRKRGHKDSLHVVLDNLGWASLLQGNPERARSYYEEGLTICKELGDKIIAPESLEGLACICASEGEVERAAKLFGAAQALCDAVGYHHTPEEAALREPYLATTRSRLGAAALKEAMAQGRAMRLEEAIEHALSGEEPSATPSSTTTAQPSVSSAPEHPAGLTSREAEVLGLVASGLTSAKIAEELFLSPRTVNTHINSIYHKLGVNSRAAATRYALENHVI